MSLEKAIQKLTSAITAARQPMGPVVDPSRPSGPVGLPPKRVLCKTEYVGTWPDNKAICVCRSKMKGDNNCVVETIEGPCMFQEGFETTVPFNAPCQGGPGQQTPGQM
jgi:hypothetical protein